MLTDSAEMTECIGSSLLVTTAEVAELVGGGLDLIS